MEEKYHRMLNIIDRALSDATMGKVLFDALQELDSIIQSDIFNSESLEEIGWNNSNWMHFREFTSKIPDIRKGVTKKVLDKYGILETLSKVKKNIQNLNY